MSSVSAVNTLLSSTSNTSPAVSLSSILAATAGTSSPGIDVTAAVAAGIYAARAPERAWQADQTTLSSQTTALTSIQTATETLATDMQNLNTLNGPLAARIVASSNSNDVTATAATGTTTGSHSVVVNSLATTAGWYSSVETLPTTPLSTSSFTLTNAAGLSKTFQTGSGTGIKNLNDLATAVSNATVGVTNPVTGTVTQVSLGVSGTVVSDSSGSRLAITSNISGAAADFSISEPFIAWTAPPIAAGVTLGANSIALTINGTPVTVSTTSGQSYADLANTINNLSANTTTTVGPPPSTTTGAFVKATAGVDANGNSTLTLVSTDNTTQFSINEPSSSGTSLGFTQAAQGADASVTVDGVPGLYSSNTVTGAIPGVTFSLLGANPGYQIGLTIASDAAQVSTAINQFVNDYNSAIGLVTAQFGVDNTTHVQGVLGSDATIVSLQSTLEQALNYSIIPATGTPPSVAMLSDLGISMNHDGTLSMNSATLNAALINNPSDVQNFFEGPALNGFANSAYNALNAFLNPVNGAFKVDLSSIAATSASLTSHINDFEAGYIASQQTLLTAEYSKAEIALQQLPQQMAQLNAELGLTSNGSGH
jgi:flagellar hook-associated protein 2